MHALRSTLNALGWSLLAVLALGTGCDGCEHHAPEAPLIPLHTDENLHEPSTAIGEPRGDAPEAGGPMGLGTGKYGSCTDGQQNGEESDVDCGGHCPKCAIGQHCDLDSDCGSGVCTGAASHGPEPSDHDQGKTCAPPTL